MLNLSSNLNLLRQIAWTQTIQNNETTRNIIRTYIFEMFALYSVIRWQFLGLARKCPPLQDTKPIYALGNFNNGAQRYEQRDANNNMRCLPPARSSKGTATLMYKNISRIYVIPLLYTVCRRDCRCSHFASCNVPPPNLRLCYSRPDAISVQSSNADNHTGWNICR